MRPTLSVLALLLAMPVLAEDEPPAPPDTAKTIFVGANPLTPVLGLVTGGGVGSSATAEYLFAKHHGAAASFAFSFGATRGWSGGLAYRYHFDRTLESAYFGPTLRVVRTTTDVKPESTTFPLEVSGWIPGLQYGHVFTYPSGFAWSWGIGYGYPFLDLRWKQGAPEKDAELLRKITRWASGIDGNFALGWSF